MLWVHNYFSPLHSQKWYIQLSAWLDSSSNNCNMASIDKEVCLIIHNTLHNSSTSFDRCSYTSLSLQSDTTFSVVSVFPQKLSQTWLSSWHGPHCLVLLALLGNEAWKWCTVMGCSTAQTRADDHQAGWWLLLIQYLKCFHGGPPNRRDHTKTQKHRWSVESTPVFNLAPEQWFFGSHECVMKYS